MSKLISLILPVYNGEQYIADTIKSILNQTFTNFELVIVNDGSTDETINVIKKFNDPRIVLFSIPHKGIIYAFNYALKKISTKYIARIDADDIYFKLKLKKQFDYLETHKNVVLCGTNAVYMAENGKVSKLKVSVPAKNNDIIKNLFSRKRAMIQSTILARTEVIKKINGYRQDIYPEDYDLFFRINQFGKLHNLVEPLAAIRIHKSYSHKNLLMLIKGHEKLNSNYKINYHLDRQTSKASLLSIYLNRLSLYYYLNNKILFIIPFTLSFFVSPFSFIRNIIKKMTN